MKYISVCSGIEAATVAWHGLGWKAAAYSEIEAFPSAVLAHHYPDIPNVGDMTKFKEWNIEPGSIDLLVGGTPCQSFSVAGLRKGLADPRGNLALTYCAILDHLKPRWFVWENVPGVLSSGGGRDFGSFLGAVAELGYGFAYRVLDAQYFGVAQRRRRVFVVGHLGNWEPAAKVLFERESLRRDSAPSREKGKAVAGTIEASLGRSRGAGTPTSAICPTLRAGGNRTGGDRPPGTDVDTADSLIVQPYPVANTLTASNDPSRSPQSSEITAQVAAVAATAMQVRRLTPVECERLQGFPDNYTAIPWRGKAETSDGPRYKALGNSMAVPVMAWIGKRIQEFEAGNAS
jgi:DNA (cytosine-5)-methyltransferase 1